MVDLNAEIVARLQKQAKVVIVEMKIGVITPACDSLDYSWVVMLLVPS